MCGRYALITSTPEIARILGANGELDPIGPRYNVAPTQEMPVLRTTPAGTVELTAMRWGLVPFWAKDLKIGSRMINARSETVAEKPSFRAAFKQRRCLVPADGYFEWRKRADGAKQPYYVTRSDGQSLFFAGLWERWRNPDTQIDLHSYTILTTPANTRLSAVHHRMPVMVDLPNAHGWIRGSTAPADTLFDLLASYIVSTDAVNFDIRPVSTTVNSPRNDDDRCIEAIAEGM